MQAVAAGDLDAFGEIITRHQSMAWSVAYRFLGDATEAEDAAQDAFLRVLEAAPRYRPTAAFRTYLYRVVTRLCLDRLEKKRPRYVDQLPATPSADLGPPETLARRESADAVRRALEVLPARQRAAVVLRHYEGLSYQEIADAMNASVKSVERLLVRGRESLADRLQEFRKE
jgi:RNA polymerase sigma-70 factor (ECF subfamily)